MYATLRRCRILDGDPRDLSRLVEDGLVPILKRNREFVGYQLIASRDEVTSITTYENRAAAEASNETARDWVNRNLTGKVSTPQVTVGEVLLSIVPQPLHP